MTRTTHLDRHRPLIVLRSLVSSVAAFVPVPLIDDFLSTAARRALIRRLAELREVDIDDTAVAELARIREAPTHSKLHWLGLLSRRLARPLQIFQRTDELVDLLCVATLFDHYCALHHVGFGVDETRARELRETMNGAMSAAPVRVLEGGLKRLVALPDVRRRWRRLLAALGRGPLEPDVIGAPATQELVGYTDALTAAFDERWLNRLPARPRLP